GCTTGLSTRSCPQPSSATDTTAPCPPRLSPAALPAKPAPAGKHAGSWYSSRDPVAAGRVQMNVQNAADVHDGLGRLLHAVAERNHDFRLCRGQMGTGIRHHTIAGIQQ